MVTTNISDEGKRVITLTPRTAKGKATRIDTKDKSPTAETEDGDATAEVAVNEDGTLAVTVTSGTVDEGADFKVSTIKVKADADMDEGEERSIEETIIVTVTRAEASNFDAVEGEEVPKD